jgi:hypothetical protein
MSAAQPGAALEAPSPGLIEAFQAGGWVEHPRRQKPKGRRSMASLLIQVDADPSEELARAFPHLVARHHSASTLLIGTVADQQEMLGVMNLLATMGIDILVMISIPTD